MGIAAPSMRSLWKLLFVFACVAVIESRAEAEEEEEDDEGEDDEGEEDDEESPQAIMREMDKDKDGKLSLKELVAFVDDEDGDSDEAKKMQEEFGKHDADKDGKIDIN